MDIDYHVHSEYSDGAPVADMVATAAGIGLSGIGFADHCNVSHDEIRDNDGLKDRLEYADLHSTYPERRRELRQLDDRHDLHVFDTVELDYFPGDEANIATFLAEAEFDYAIGSIHFVDGIHFCNNGYFEAKSEAERRDLLEVHLNDLVALIESELFDIAAHVDVFERYPAFRGLIERQDYEPVIDALEESRTVPEINIGRLFTEFADSNPRRELAAYLEANGIRFTYGSDAHTPTALERSSKHLRQILSDQHDFVTLAV